MQGKEVDLGYWIGHQAGWSADANWPFKIGGGEDAIAMSIGLPVLGVLIAGWVLALPPHRHRHR